MRKRIPPLHFFFVSFFVLIAVYMPVATQAQEDTILKGKVKLPGGVSPSGIIVQVFDTDPSLVASDHVPLVRKTLGEDAAFELVVQNPEPVQIEFTGDGIRRARFPWPDAATPVFPVEAGVTATLRCQDAESAEPVTDVLLGPVSPGPEASVELLEKCYPFFERSDETGGIFVSGLIPGIAYEGMIAAPGYHRSLVRFTGGEDKIVELQPGGLELQGQVINDNDQSPMTGVDLQIFGGPEVMVRTRSGENGLISVGGLKPAVYTVLPITEGGFEKPTQIPLSEDTAGTSWIIPVPTGITISGVLADVESGAPVADAVIELGDRIARTGEEGRFLFEDMQGPWPVHATVTHPEYRFDRNDQSLDHYPINGITGNDLDDVLLTVRRNRVLAVDFVNTAPPCRGVLSLYDATGREEANVFSFRQCQETFSLDSAGERLAVALSQDRLVSEQKIVYTDLSQTTTTLSLELGAPGSIETQLQYPDSEETGEYPVYNMELSIPTQSGTIDLRSFASGVTGNVEAQYLAPGNYTVILLGKSGRIFREEILRIERGQTAQVTATVLRGYKLEGVVSDQNGKSLGQIPLMLYGEDIEGSPLTLQKMTGDDGSFEFAGLGQEIDQIRIDHSMYRREILEDIQLPSDPLEIVLEEKPGVKIRLSGGTMAGGDAEAILFVCVENQAPGGGTQWFANVDASERFLGQSETLLSPRSTGRMRAAVVSNAEWDVSEPFGWSSESENLEFVLTPGKTASLRVSVDGLGDDQTTDDLDATLINTTLPEERAATEFSPTSRRRSELVFDGLPAGDYILLLSDLYGATATKTNIAIESGSRERLDASLSGNSAPLYGQVVDGAGDPVSGAKVKVMFGDIPEPDVLDETTSNVAGDFTFESLLPGRPYLLEISSGSEKEIYTANASSDSVQEFVLERRVEVEILFPPQLLQRALARPNVPFMAQPEAGGQMTMFHAESDGNVQVLLRPGPYKVLWGEENLQKIEVSRRGGRIQLVE